MPAKIDLINKRFGRLLVLEEEKERTKSGGVRYKCQCDCGNIKIVTSQNLKRKNTISCGCYMRECSKKTLTQHGYFNTLTHNSWRGMKDRCNNSNHIYFHRYGGRGIQICRRWRNSFENFLKDMGERPKGMTLDRIDVNGPYGKWNCKWSTYKEQGRDNYKKKLINTKERNS